jgi:hypothetical protein
LRLSSHSPWRALVLSLVIIGVRHWRAPAPRLDRRLRGALEFWPDDRPIVAVALASRVAVLVAAFFAVLTIGPPPGTLRLTQDPLLDLPNRFDAAWYASIAIDGYRFDGNFSRQQNIAFFPGYPLMMRAAGMWTGAWELGVPKHERTARAMWGGVTIAIAAFVWAAIYLRRLAADVIGEPRAVDAAMLLAAYPFAVAFSAPYTESLFLLGCVAALYHFRRRSWMRAALWGGLVGFTRPNGCLLSVVLACVIVEDVWRRRSAWREYPFGRALASAAAPGLTMLVHTVYLHQVTGVWFAWTRIQIAWGRSFQGLSSVTSAIDRLGQEGLLGAIAYTPFDAVNAIAFVFAVVMLPPVFRHVGLAGGAFVLLNIVPPLLTGGVLSMGRFTSTLFPVFLALAAIVPARAIVPLLTTFAVGQGLVTAVFFTWRGLF